MNYLKSNAAYLTLSLAIILPSLSRLPSQRNSEPSSLESKIVQHHNVAQREPIQEQFQLINYNPTDDFSNDTDEVLLARLLYGEARGAPREVKYAIANVVLNRAERPCWWGRNVREVILAPRQFSCFNIDDVNRHKLLDPTRYEQPEVWQECYNVAREALSQRHDTTRGATHYFDSSITTPRWARNQQPSLELPAGNGRVIRFYNTVL